MQWRDIPDKQRLLQSELDQLSAKSTEESEKLTKQLKDAKEAAEKMERARKAQVMENGYWTGAWFIYLLW